VGVEFLRLVARAEELGLDPEQEARSALRALEERVRAAEGPPGWPPKFVAGGTSGNELGPARIAQSGNPEEQGPSASSGRT
jgi:hypothetical protein